jgi:hypothetical protein
VLLAILCRTAPQALIGVSTEDPEVVFVGTEYLRIMSWSFVASGVVSLLLLAREFNRLRFSPEV